MANMNLKASLFLACSLGSALPVVAQGYRDFTIVRNRPQAYSSLLQLRTGYRGVEAEGIDDPLISGHAADDTIDGFVYFHTKDLVRGEDWVLDSYAGLDGIYAGLKGDMHPGKTTQSRIEVFSQHSAHYRPGYYSAGDYVPVGHYQGEDYTVRIGTAQVVDRGLILEFAAYYKDYAFSESEEPASVPNQFVLPDNFAAYGSTITLEQNSLQMDRILGLPMGGLLWTVQIDYETNDSGKEFGWINQSPRSLSKSYYRGETRFEAYVANGQSSAWAFLVDAGYYDSSDFITASRSNQVQGHMWGDGSFGYRMAFGDWFLLKPFAQLQYSKSLDITGVSSREKLFWGGGAHASLIFAKNIALVFEYSYVNNPSRPNVSPDRDLYGEHQFFIGMDVSFGSGYRQR
jgi:hypothetical protein